MSGGPSSTTGRTGGAPTSLGRQGDRGIQAGLPRGDILVAMEGDPVPDTEARQTALGPDRVGESSRIDVLRGGEPAELSATLVERG